MSDKKREPININTSDNATLPSNKSEEPGLPVKIPLSIVRWLAYSILFMFLLMPFVTTDYVDGIKAACGGLILGHFASQLNALIKK